MTNLDLVSALVGVLLPPLVAVVNQPRWPSWARALVAVVSSVAAGGMTAWVAGDLAGMSGLRAVLVVVAATLAAYRAWWQPSGIAPWLEHLTAVGTIGTAREGEHEA